MKRKYLVYLLTLLMALSPAAVFADAAGEEAPEEAIATEEVQDVAETAEEEAAPAEEVIETEAVVEETAEPAGEEVLEVVDPEPAKNARNPYDPCTWKDGSNRGEALDADGNPVKGLFKASMEAGGTGLYYAGDNYQVVKKAGLITVTGSASTPVFLYHPWTQDDAREFWKDYSTGTYTYLIDNHSGDYYIEYKEGTHKVDGKSYYVLSNGTVRTTAGIQLAPDKAYYYINSDYTVQMTAGFTPDHKYFIPAADGKIRTTQGTFSYNGKTYYAGAGGVIPSVAGLYSWNGSQYYVNADGSVKTTAGFITANGKKYLVNAGGAIRTTAGPVSYGGSMYVAESGGAIRTATGFYNAAGKLYYVSNSAGVLTVNKAFKVGSKKYHAMSNGVIAVGAHKWGKYYYYSEANGALRTKAGIVKYAGKYYHVKKGGKVTTNKKVKYKKKYYIASKTGAIYTRIFTWKKNMYYASGKGVLRTKAGFVTYDGMKYYVRKGGKIYRNTVFKAGGKKYLALSDGHIGAGLYVWKGNRYLTNAKGAIISTEGLYDFGGTTYSIKSGGVIPSNTFVTFKDKHYYAGSDGSIVKSKFTYKKITIKPNSKTGEISMEDYVKVFPEAAPKETDDNN